MNRTNKVLIIYTGGTIGMGKNPRTGALEPLDFALLRNKVSELEYVGVDIDTFQFNPPIDSSEMKPSHWADMVRIISSHYDEYDGFVILHGTDTMAYTASALSFMLENLTKPVVLTGSQLPIGQLRTDGKENLVTSIELAAACDEEGRPVVPEVCIYFNGKLLRGNRSTKQNADGFDAFTSFNFPALCDVGVNMVYNRPLILRPDYEKPMIPHTSMDNHVVVFSLFPGIEEGIIRHMFSAQGLRSIVMRSYGSGNAPREEWLIKLLKEARERGIIVVNISQCVKGLVAMNRYDTGYQLQDIGIIGGLDSTVEAAITKLMFLQANYDNPQVIGAFMGKSIAGEI